MTRNRATWFAVLALIFWSTSLAMVRSLAEPLGPFTFLLVTSASGGIILWVAEIARCRSLQMPFALPTPYLLLGGTTFVAYFVLFTAALSLAPTRAVAVQIGLINYLWPALLLVFSIPVFGLTMRWFFVPGVVISILGSAIGTLDLASLKSLSRTLAGHALPFLLMSGATLSWAGYSILARKLAGKRSSSGTHLFLLLTALAAAFLRALTQEESRWTAVQPLPLAYVSVLPNGLCYLFWELGMRHGDQTLLGACSYALPVASTLFSCWYLGIVPSQALLIGCLLVVGGALLCHRGIRQARGVP